MKKVVSSFLLALFITFTISACTEENIKPQDGGGQAGDCDKGWGCK